MKPLAIAAVCAGLAAAPLVAKAADLVLFDATGRPVAVLVPTDTAPAGLFAEQDAVFQHIMDSMQMMEAAFDAGPLTLDPASLGRMQPGATIVTTSISDGHSSCSRTVTYEQRGGGAPLVQVRQTGDACDALPAAPRGGAVPAALPQEPAPEQAMPPRENPNSPKLIRVDYRHPAVKPQPRRS